MTATEPIFDITSEREELDAMTMAALKRRYQEETAVPDPALALDRTGRGARRAVR